MAANTANTRDDQPPTVSVVVPCRNEKDHIETCLRSILAQEAPRGGFEVIVADAVPVAFSSERSR